MSYREVTAADRLKVVVYLVLMILFNVVTAFFLMERAWPWGFIIWLILCFGGSLILLVFWHARVTAYRCPDCRTAFEISFFTDLFSMHSSSKKFLKCPQCGKRGWAAILMKAD